MYRSWLSQFGGFFLWDKIQLYHAVNSTLDDCPLPTVTRTRKITRRRQVRVNVTEIWMRREIRGVVSHGIVVDQAISDQHRDWNGWAHSQRLEAVPAVFTDVSFLLVAVVLEPDFYLSGCQAYHSSQVLSLRCRQVTLLAKSTLQFERLCLGEKHSSLPLLLFRLVVLLRFNVREGQMTRLFFCLEKKRKKKQNPG